MTERGTGRTTKQMVSAPACAVFVWCNGMLSYPNQLAQFLGRKDLEIVGPSWLEMDSWRGRDRLAFHLVTDHALHMTIKQYERYRDIMACLQ
jgi:hypothetical protein